MDYTSLIAGKATAGSLADRINYANLPAAELVKNAQDEIFARLRVREMRKGLVLALAAGASTFPVPGDFLDLDSLIDPYGRKLTRISDDRLLALRTFDATGALLTSIPFSYGLFDGALQFDCAANAAMTLQGMYYAATYLSNAATTSFLTARYSNLFWAVLLKLAYGYRKDFQAATAHAADAESLFQQIEMMDDLSYRGLDDADFAGMRA